MASKTEWKSVLVVAVIPYSVRLLIDRYLSSLAINTYTCTPMQQSSNFSFPQQPINCETSRSASLRSGCHGKIWFRVLITLNKPAS